MNRKWRQNVACSGRERVKKKLAIATTVLTVFLSAILVVASGCAVDRNTDETAELKPLETTEYQGVDRNTYDAAELKPLEITEYQGKNLSSVDDFSENSIKGPQYVDIQSYQLKITGLIEHPKTYTYEEVVNNHIGYKKVVTLNCVEGWSATILWEGLLVSDLIAESTPLPNAKVVIFHAYDGYTSSLPLDYIIDNDILIAYKMNGIAMPPERGSPFQLVAESKWGYKWIKWITEIELSDDVAYRGFWESAGFSNNADLDKDFLEE